jgi:hypothetical protein
LWEEKVMAKAFSGYLAILEECSEWDSSVLRRLLASLATKVLWLRSCLAKAFTPVRILCLKQTRPDLVAPRGK